MNKLANAMENGEFDFDGTHDKKVGQHFYRLSSPFIRCSYSCCGAVAGPVFLSLLFSLLSSACPSLWFWSFSSPSLLYRLVNWFTLTLCLCVSFICVYMFLCIKTNGKKKEGGVIVQPVLKCLRAFLVFLGKFAPGKLDLKGLKM